MTSSELKYLYETNEKETGKHFFTRNTMKFFGDTMSNYGVCKTIVNNKWDNSDSFECFKLYRKKPVKHNLQTDAFFSLKGEHLCGVKESSHELL